MKAHRETEHTLAVFIDFENLALGFSGRRERFEIHKVLERLVEKGKIVVKKAYSDWSRFGQYTGPLHECAIELIEIPKRSVTGKNSADIRLVVDAIDLAYSKDHIDTFVIVSGDSDFSPLVSKLKELGKHVLGVGLAEATSNLLRDNCDEFIYYEDLGKVAPANAMIDDAQLPEQKQKLFNLLMDSLLALRRENKDVLYSSMVKDTMKRKKPSFNEEFHGFRTFSELLEDAQKHGLLDLEKSKTSGTYVVTRFGTEPKQAEPSRKPVPEGEPRPAARRRTTGRRRVEPDEVPGLKPVLIPVQVPVQVPVKPDEVEDVPSYRPRKIAVETQPLPPQEPPPLPKPRLTPRVIPVPPRAPRPLGDDFGAGLE
ncbi:hypothetical protein BH11PLA2_BH11PLA2_02150 [soil metagenome]